MFAILDDQIALNEDGFEETAPVVRSTCGCLSANSHAAFSANVFPALYTVNLSVAGSSPCSLVTGFQSKRQ